MSKLVHAYLWSMVPVSIVLSVLGCGKKESPAVLDETAKARSYLQQYFSENVKDQLSGESLLRDHVRTHTVIYEQLAMKGSDDAMRRQAAIAIILGQNQGAIDASFRLINVPYTPIARRSFSNLDSLLRKRNSKPLMKNEERKQLESIVGRKHLYGMFALRLLIKDAQKSSVPSLSSYVRNYSVLTPDGLLAYKCLQKLDPKIAKQVLAEQKLALGKIK